MAAIHYNSTQKGEASGQIITAKDIIITYGAKPFALGASARGGASLSYTSSNDGVASVAPDGTVTVKK